MNFEYKLCSRNKKYSRNCQNTKNCPKFLQIPKFVTVLPVNEATVLSCGTIRKDKLTFFTVVLGKEAEPQYCAC